MKLTKNFTLEEFTRSETASQLGIVMNPREQIVENIRALCVNVLQPLRDYIGKPIIISSGYRTKTVNTLVGGAKNSQHMTGEAADINVKGDMVFLRSICQFIREYLVYDQLIIEHNKAGRYWVHVSYKRDGSNRKQFIENLLKQ